MDQLHKYQDRLDIILDNQSDTLKLSKALVNRLNEIVKVSSSFRDIAEMKYIFDTNQQCHEKVKAVTDNLGEVSRMLHETEMNILMQINMSLKKDIKEKREELRAMKEMKKGE